MVDMWLYKKRFTSKILKSIAKIQWDLKSNLVMSKVGGIRLNWMVIFDSGPSISGRAVHFHDTVHFEPEQLIWNFLDVTQKKNF